MVVNPTLPRAMLGGKLRALRLESKKTEKDVGDAIRYSRDKIRKIEEGLVRVTVPDLMALLGIYGVTDPEIHALCMEWRDQGDQRGWWSQYGLTEATSKFVGYETAAKEIKIWEPSVVPGLLQTEDYARAVMETIAPDADIDRAAQLRLERQHQVFEAESSPAMHVILEETAVRRPVGGSDVLHGQLARLLDGPWTLQVVPLSTGANPGGPGSFWIFTFPPDTRTPVVYIETHAGNLYLDDDKEVERSNLTYESLRAVALNPKKTRELIRTVMEELKT